MPDETARGVFDADIGQFLAELKKLEDELGRLEARFPGMGGVATQNLQSAACA